MPYYADLSIGDKITVIKREYSEFIKTIFHKPESLQSLVDQNKITIGQAKSIIKSLEKLNASDCVCCRRYSPDKLKLKPIDKDLDPLLEVARDMMRKKYL
jgi:hypothetical protein